DSRAAVAPIPRACSRVFMVALISAKLITMADAAVLCEKVLIARSAAAFQKAPVQIEPVDIRLPPISLRDCYHTLRLFSCNLEWKVTTARTRYTTTFANSVTKICTFLQLLNILKYY